jgi:hypothetical protein
VRERSFTSIFLFSFKKSGKERIDHGNTKKIRYTVLRLAGKKVPAENPSEITVGTLNIVLDATPFHELTAIEAVVRSHQERLLVLQKVREALKWLDQLGDTDGLKYMVLEDEGIPERILFKIA